jgi:hypothetical protein
VWVLSVIRGGLDLVFQEHPPLSDSPIPMSRQTGPPEIGKPCCSRQIGEISWKPKNLGYGNKHPKGPVWWSTYLEEYKL